MALTLTTWPPGARSCCCQVVEQDRVLVSTAERTWGGRRWSPCPSRPGAAPSRSGPRGGDRGVIPVMAWQGDTSGLSVRIPTEEELGADFAFVAGGHYVRGTDPEAILARPSGLVQVAPFAIARHPVTCGEYFEFLNDLNREDALRHAPRAPGQGVIVPPGPTGWAAPTRDVDGDVWDPRWPVFNISYEDAEAYAAWRSRRDGVAYRLPTEDEWEKAARGADGRIFPWGDHFDPTFCRMRTSVPGDLPRPVGSYPDVALWRPGHGRRGAGVGGWLAGGGAALGARPGLQPLRVSVPGGEPLRLLAAHRDRGAGVSAGEGLPTGGDPAAEAAQAQRRRRRGPAAPAGRQAPGRVGRRGRPRSGTRRCWRIRPLGLDGERPRGRLAGAAALVEGLDLPLVDACRLRRGCPGRSPGSSAGPTRRTPRAEAVGHHLVCSCAQGSSTGVQVTQASLSHLAAVQRGLVHRLGRG
ncbi:MAG: SUMF1/EgtB/PvdO family nonheme iron enzyme [bacterium]